METFQPHPGLPAALIAQGTALHGSGANGGWSFGVVQWPSPGPFPLPTPSKIYFSPLLTAHPLTLFSWSLGSQWDPDFWNFLAFPAISTKIYICTTYLFYSVCVFMHLYIYNDTLYTSLTNVYIAYILYLYSLYIFMHIKWRYILGGPKSFFRFFCTILWMDLLANPIYEMFTIQCI